MEILYEVMDFSCADEQGMFVNNYVKVFELSTATHVFALCSMPLNHYYFYPTVD